MKYDYIVIGGGSGGIASARRAAAHGAKVAIAEGARWGGTCVNVGCVPKKIMWWASNVKHIMDEAINYGFQSEATYQFSWSDVKRRRDQSVARLNQIYINNLAQSGVTHHQSYASFLAGTTQDGLHEIQLAGGEVIAAPHVLIATGGKPQELSVPGSEFAISSDGFFDLEQLPRKTAVIGAGYIAVELAGLLHGLGCETHLFVRGQTALRQFDSMVAIKLHEEMIQSGLAVHGGSIIKAFKKDDMGNLSVELENNTSIGGFSVVLVAIGRTPEHSKTNLVAKEIALTKSGHVKVDEYQNTTTKGIYAVGDVVGKVELTPVAIAAGRRLADRLFGNKKDAKIEYDLVPTVIFSHPPIGSIGLTEATARSQYGDADIEVYTNTSVNLYYNVFDIPPEKKPRTHIKMICVKSLRYRVVGLHMIGMAVDEILQGFGVAIKMGATKEDFDNCMAIHPTAGEEVVTMRWGMV